MEIDKRGIIDAAIAANCDVPDIFISTMNFFIHDVDLVSKTLKAVHFLLVLEENTMDLEVENPFSFKIKLERYGILNVLRRYENTENNELYELIQNIIEEFSPEQS